MPTQTAFSMPDAKHFLTQEKQTPEPVYKAYFPNEALAHQVARGLHDNIRQTDYTLGYLVLSLNASQQETLKALGFKLEVASEWSQKRAQQIDNALADGGLISDKLKRDGITGFECYDTVETSFERMQQIVEQHPDLAQMVDIGDSWQKANGGVGYDLQVLKLSNKKITGPKPTLFLQAAMHAREYTTAALALDFATELVQQYGKNPDITWILDYHDLQFLVHSNPDGRKQAEAGVLWRKNANTSFCPESVPGVDLNRNFSLLWGIDNIGSSNAACSTTFRGILPGSEPEVSAVETYIKQLFADTRGPDINDAAMLDTQGLHLDIHSSGSLILWPWGHTTTPPPNAKELQTLGRKMAFFNGYMPTQATGDAGLPYYTNGTSDEVSYGELGIPSYTFELGTEFFESCENYVNTIRPDNFAALTYAAKILRAPYQLPAGPELINLTLNSNISQEITLIQGDPLTLRAIADDSRSSSRNGTETVQPIGNVHLTHNTPPWLANESQMQPLSAIDGGFDQFSEMSEVTLDTSDWAQGRHTLFLQAEDSSTNKGAVSAVFVTIQPKDTALPEETQPTNDIMALSAIDSSSNSAAGSSLSASNATEENLTAASAALTLQQPFSGSSTPWFILGLFLGAILRKRLAARYLTEQ